MEEFKKDLFKKEYSKEFPIYYSLSANDCLKLKEKIVKKYDIKESNSMDFMKYISKLEEFIQHINAKDSGFSLINLLNELNVSYLKGVYVNWNQFDEIDKLCLHDLDKYFDDIWFSSSDDIDLFDDNLDWILSIRHDGAIYAYRHNF